MTERVSCSRCHMGFEIGAPVKSRGEFLVCPDCGRRFWHTDQANMTAKTGMTPEQLSAWRLRTILQLTQQGRDHD